MDTLDEDALEVYRATVRRRDEAAAAERSAKRERAWDVVRRAATMLRERFGAGRVVVFGSLIEDGGRWFGVRSDIDLAAWGIASEDVLMAVAQLQDLSPEFEVDLVAMERCPERLRDAIAQGHEMDAQPRLC